MRKTPVAIAGSALVTLVLTACGGGNAYCDEIKAAENDIGGISNPQDLTLGDFEKAADRFDDIAEEAPDSVTKEWQNTADTLDKLTEAFEDAGAESSSKLTDVVADPKFAQAAQSLSGDLTAVNTDMQKVNTNVKEECDIDLGGTSGS
ncbi:hypothetical protein [Solicola sp. PLA-1-18]|uniref:hypothetical protein n=1 Tax=Solicola sp. PLA-1-18 TaxID=3380532 RepID=UPI003B824F6B